MKQFVYEDALPAFNKQIISDSFEIRLEINVFDVYHSSKHAVVEICLRIANFPLNATGVEFFIEGGGSIKISCERVNDTSFYKGESAHILWKIYGIGEAYPFDSYIMKFIIRRDQIWYIKENERYKLENVNFSISQARSHVRFMGLYTEYLEGMWTTDENYELPTKYRSNELIVTLERKSETPFLQIIFPIILCYVFLGVSLFLDAESKLTERLAIYIALFVFTPSFLLAIQDFLPLRSSLSIPEFLLTNLIISTALFGIFSIIHPILKDKRHPYLLDVSALIIAIFSYVSLYLTFFRTILKLLPLIVMFAPLCFCCLAGFLSIIMRMKMGKRAPN